MTVLYYVLKLKFLINAFKNFEYLLDFTNLDENQELFGNTNKVVDKFNIETLKNVWIYEFIALRSKAYSFKCDGKNANKLRGISKSCSKKMNFEEDKKCLDGEEYQKESNNYILKSFFLEMYLRKIKLSSLSISDDKRNYLNNTKSLHWK